MDFLLSKLLWTITQPATALFFAVFLGWALQSWMPRISRVLLASAALFLLLLSAGPVGRWCLTPLEDRFPRHPLDGPVAGIIVLGGAIVPEASEPGHAELNDA